MLSVVTITDTLSPKRKREKKNNEIVIRFCVFVRNYFLIRNVELTQPFFAVCPKRRKNERCDSVRQKSPVKWNRFWRSTRFSAVQTTSFGIYLQMHSIRIWINFEIGLLLRSKNETYQLAVVDQMTSTKKNHLKWLIIIIEKQTHIRLIINAHALISFGGTKWAYILVVKYTWMKSYINLRFIYQLNIGISSHFFSSVGQMKSPLFSFQFNIIRSCRCCWLRDR